MAANPIEQFEIKNLIPLGNIGGQEIAFTNSALFMVGAVALITLGFTAATAGRSLVPGRAQAAAEMLYEFVANTLRQSAGEKGMKFFPFVFSLFMFVLTCNMLGMIPGFFTVTSHVIVTFALAILVIGTVIVYGFVKHGTHFLGLFVPSGVPAWLLPFMVVIELISFLSRPISLSLRLFANMLAGHVALKVFAGFIVALGGLAASGGMTGVLGVAGAALPLAMAVALTAFEFLVAFLQAYVFTILTCIYLHDALHPGH
ncbi:F0F1 ATP synthase subunit A [Chelatococcus daeguensis]|uniref:ATP synthase subunit a n=2 Tax=Chelatococcus TaxID=28209 RepID=A0AAC9JN65_9HYPH|nr:MULTISPECIES: F0F1 ATP synthase subunit A [Chelatococcus]APF36882.1 F0F1 ATP synthase subunit A [Chelatococcus daeguensis]KZE28065.1 ATP synthase F0F1 subunit A [Chelatococcus daeguensis]MBM3084639.1 F0F1 ATP synthase subunit A [Chelatococcus daeguensis]CUA88255.1 ATP synthase F0 subcomplex A subunit [Chelatococcus sambhunathii]